MINGDGGSIHIILNDINSLQIEHSSQIECLGTRFNKSGLIKISLINKPIWMNKFDLKLPKITTNILHKYLRRLPPFERFDWLIKIN